MLHALICNSDAFICSNMQPGARVHATGFAVFVPSRSVSLSVLEG